jgi:sec-independent protein translocase protein TatA
MLGPLEFTLIAIAVLLLFGGSKLPGLASGLGKAIRNFKHSLRGDDGIEVRRVDKENESDDDSPEKS